MQNVIKSSFDDKKELIVKEAETSVKNIDQQEVDKVKNSIDINDSVAIIQYGNSAQKEIASFSTSVLEKVKNNESGTAGALLSNLMSDVKSLDVENLSVSGFLSKLPIIGGLFDKFQSFIKGFNSVSNSIDEISSKLESEKMSLLREIEVLDRLFDHNLDLLKNLEIYIEAGEQKIKEVKEDLLPKLMEKAQTSKEQMDTQKYKDANEMLTRLEKKVHDLRLNKTISIQNAPQIRLAQEGSKVLAEKLQSSLFQTIPLWKNQMVLAISLYKQGKAAKLQKAVSDTTNELLKKNSQILKENSIEIAKESERGIVDIQTLKKVNQDLISTLDEILIIQKDGKIARQNAVQELEVIENELKEKLLESKENTIK